MTERQTSDPLAAPTREEAVNQAMNEPVPAPDDPSRAHAKGYSADPDPNPARPVPEQGPVPLVGDADVQGHARKPDDGPLPPTGRAEPSSPKSEERVLGADR